ncbi:hypothetical protein E2320_023071 [Naja naja]|nr:hypothetical protein E2320_023071 [Naja naja]
MVVSSLGKSSVELHFASKLGDSTKYWKNIVEKKAENQMLFGGNMDRLLRLGGGMPGLGQINLSHLYRNDNFNHVIDLPMSTVVEKDVRGTHWFQNR